MGDIVKTNIHGTNAKFIFNILSDEDMRKVGFTDYSSDRWYYCKSLRDSITFDVTIYKDGSDAWIDVLDEDYLQPYDFQNILQKNPDNVYAQDINTRVIDHMLVLQQAGILQNYVIGDYI